MTDALKIDSGKGTPLWIADRPGGGFLIKQARSVVRLSDAEARELVTYILGVLDA